MKSGDVAVNQKEEKTQIIRMMEVIKDRVTSAERNFSKRRRRVLSLEKFILKIDAALSMVWGYC